MLAIAGLALAAACDSDSVSETVTGQTLAPPPTAGAASSVQPANVLAAGEFKLPAAEAFDEPGFHAALGATHDLPAGQASVAGKRLVFKLPPYPELNITRCRGH